MVRLVLCTASLLVILATPACSPGFDELMPAAQRGDTAAQIKLGDMYVNGQGVPKDFTKAANWYRKAAEKGHPEGQFKLGVRYEGGVGVLHDKVEAARFSRTPNEQRDVEMVRWHRKAAEQGHAGAQLKLSIFYNIGAGVGKDDVLAYMWADLAATKGYQNSAGFRDSIAKSMRPVQISKAQRLVREWMETHRRKK